MRRVVTVIVGIASLSAAQAQHVALPAKDTWSLASGGNFEGRALGYNYRMLFIQRRHGQLWVNGAKVKKPSDDALLAAVCRLNEVPITDGKALQAKLSRQPGAQVIVPYYTLQYVSSAGVNNEVPVVLLSLEDVADLRPSFDAWLAERQREYQEQLFRLQQLANQQQMLAIQQEQLRVQQSMMQASWAQVEAIEDQQR